MALSGIVDGKSGSLVYEAAEIGEVLLYISPSMGLEGALILTRSPSVMPLAVTYQVYLYEHSAFRQSFPAPLTRDASMQN
jgi:hypothetical protein